MNLSDYINEQLVLERFLRTFKKDKFKIDLTGHGDDRKLRDGNYYSDSSIVCSICKAFEDIKKDYANGVLKIKDTFAIIDISKSFNVLCALSKYHEFTVIRVITIKERKDFKPKSKDKIYKPEYMTDKTIAELYNIRLSAL